jgi:hypothetical protein
MRIARSIKFAVIGVGLVLILDGCYHMQNPTVTALVGVVVLGMGLRRYPGL